MSSGTPENAYELRNPGKGGGRFSQYGEQKVDSLIFVEEILTHPLGPIAWEACRPHPAEH